MTIIVILIIIIIYYHFQYCYYHYYNYSLIENDHLGDWSPEKDCCWRLTFRQPVRKPCSESSDVQSQVIDFRLLHRLSKRQSPTTVLVRTPVTQMIILNQGISLLASNHFLLIIFINNIVERITAYKKYWLS